MNESTLNALMRLFANCCREDDDHAIAIRKRNIVADYLNRHYSHETAQKYIVFYENKVQDYNNDNGVSYHSEGIYKRTKAENRIIEQCNKINIELEHAQKIILLIYLLDLIHSSDNLTEDEMSLVWHVADNLKIREDEFLGLKYFTFDDIENIAHHDWLYFINCPECKTKEGYKQFTIDEFEGQLKVLHVPSSNTYVLRYYGNMTLLLNGHVVKTAQSYVWTAGSVIRNPRIGYIYYNWIVSQFTKTNGEGKFVLTAEDIAFKHLNSKNGIKTLNLSEESGRLVAILGSSGSGKTTLLNLLNSNLKPQKGAIKINGWDLHKNRKQLKGIIGYVPQDDVLIKELTAYQNLYFTAKLCFSNYSEEKIKNVVERALEDFDLVEAKDLTVGDEYSSILSGGQRKRLNIAMELIREPSILLVDEPTSGLSSSDSEKVIILLKSQTLKGKLVIVNIHQPSSDCYKMIDKLLVMDQGGRAIYYGHPESAISYFKTEANYVDNEETECLSCGNIDTDLILRIAETRYVDGNGKLTRIRKKSPEEWYAKYLSTFDVEVKKNLKEHDSSVPRNNYKVPGLFNQFKIFFHRDVLSKYYNKQYLILLIVEAPILAIMLAYFSKHFTFVNGTPRYFFGENDSIPAFLFMAVIVSLFLGLVISAEEIFKDRKILIREKFLHLSRFSYLSSKILILFIISAVQSLVFLLISNAILEIKGMLLQQWLILFTASCWANLMGLNISSGFKSVIAIYVIVPLILVPQLIFSGVVLDFTKMHNKGNNDKVVPLVGDMMASRWAYEALAVAQFKDNRFEKNFYKSEAKAKNASFNRSFAIPELIDITNDIITLSKSQKDNMEYLNMLSVLKNGVIGICNDMPCSTPNFIDSMVPALYKPSLNPAILDFLNTAEVVYKNRYNQAVAERDHLYKEFTAKLGNADQFILFKQRFYNKKLASLVNDEPSIQNYTIHSGEMIPLKDAIYRNPDKTSWRAHFYSPVKYMFRQEVDTFWFNLSFIWFFSLLLFGLLYFDIARRTLKFFEILQMKRSNKIRFIFYHK
jgi:ABC-type multidrug transport system ATPase subunit